MSVAEPVETLYQQVKNYHKSAFEFISKALVVDEKTDGNKDDAILYYTKGISVLEKGIGIKTLGASAQDKEKIIRLQTKMKANLSMSKERLHELANKEDFTKPRRPATKPDEKRWNPSTNGTSSLNPGRSFSATPQRPKSSIPPKRTNSVGKNDKKLNKTIKSIPKELTNRIMDTALEPGSNSVQFQDVAGQEAAKQALKEIVILPALRPDLFSGLRSPAKGLLLFGPPGNGKTLLAKAVATEAKSVFFNISAATLTSKWVGEGEKMVKALFAVAREVQPSIIFIDEIDSLLRERQESESDSTRRLQTEFLLQFDGVGTDSNDRILVMGATNRPHELDDAALRRFPKRLYIRLPDENTRAELLNMLLTKHASPLKNADIKQLARMCNNYSFSDLTDLAKDASLGPIRDIPTSQFETIDAKKMRKINSQDFVQSIKRIRPSVSLELLRTYEQWNSSYGDMSGI